MAILHSVCSSDDINPFSHSLVVYGDATAGRKGMFDGEDAGRVGVVGLV
jgi:hypothetical protein